MADLDIATERAYTRYSEENGMTPDASELSRDPHFIDMVEEEMAAIQSERSSGRHSTVSSGSCPSSDDSSGGDTPCSFSELTANKSGDGNRVYRSASATTNSISVIAGRTNTPTEMQFQLLSTEGPCSTHGTRVWDVPRNVTLVSSSDSEYKGNFLWRGRSSELSLFNGGIQPTIYAITSNTCGESHTVQVKVYPDYGWSGSATLAFRYDETTRRIEVGDVSIQWSLMDDGRTETVRVDNLIRLIRLLGNFFGFVQQAESIATTVAGSYVRWNIVPPSISVELSERWQEIQHNLECGYSCNLRFSLSPIIGITCTIMLSNLAIAAIPQVGPALVQAFGSSIERYVAITFSITGQINLAITLTKNSVDRDTSVSARVEGVAQFDLQARISPIQRDFQSFSVSCGARAGARASITISAEGPTRETRGYAVNLVANFDGLTAYWAAYMRFGTSRDTRDSDETSTGASDEHTTPWIDARELGRHTIRF